MLETTTDAYIGIVEKTLIDYRTAPVSSNVKSMTRWLDLMRFIMEKHRESYCEHIVDALLGIESISIERLYGWEGSSTLFITEDNENRRHKIGYRTVACRG
ncbi:MAG: hypothetical protein E7256_05655 [Lachnospiraceae bacterium]|nr:hypothetical protein [Lachnospiraceae bacterium]